jgi:hypothetical protein
VVKRHSFTEAFDAVLRGLFTGPPLSSLAVLHVASFINHQFLASKYLPTSNSIAHLSNISFNFTWILISKLYGGRDIFPFFFHFRTLISGRAANLCAPIYDFVETRYSVRLFFITRNVFFYDPPFSLSFSSKANVQFFFFSRLVTLPVRPDSAISSLVVLLSDLLLDHNYGSPQDP